MAGKTRGGLGKGLGALLQDNASVSRVPDKDLVQEISVDDIQANRYQPRHNFAAHIGAKAAPRRI